MPIHIAKSSIYSLLFDIIPYWYQIGDCLPIMLPLLLIPPWAHPGPTRPGAQPGPRNKVGPKNKVGLENRVPGPPYASLCVSMHPTRIRMHSSASMCLVYTSKCQYSTDISTEKVQSQKMLHIGEKRKSMCIRNDCLYRFYFIFGLLVGKNIDKC